MNMDLHPRREQQPLVADSGRIGRGAAVVEPLKLGLVSRLIVMPPT